MHTYKGGAISIGHLRRNNALVLVDDAPGVHGWKQRKDRETTRTAGTVRARVVNVLAWMRLKGADAAE